MPEQILKRIKEFSRYEAYERKEEERRDLASDYLQVTFSCSMCLWIFVADICMQTFKCKQIFFMQTTLGSTLTEVLVDCANTRPDDPVAFLADALEK